MKMKIKTIKVAIVRFCFLHVCVTVAAHNMYCQASGIQPPALRLNDAIDNARFVASEAQRM
jgi:hypothetical protein